MAEYGYDPDVTELRVVLGKSYELADRQTRALVEFGLVASRSSHRRAAHHVTSAVVSR